MTVLLSLIAVSTNGQTPTPAPGTTPDATPSPSPATAPEESSQDGLKVDVDINYGVSTDDLITEGDSMSVNMGADVQYDDSTDSATEVKTDGGYEYNFMNDEYSVRASLLSSCFSVFVISVMFGLK